jgi:hypothetical protein
LQSRGTVQQHCTIVIMSVDLTNWTVNEFAGSSTSANWQIAADGLSVLQTRNSLPSLFCSDFDASGSKLEGEIFVDTTGDDDFIGFALGYSVGDNTNENANWYLIDWKQQTQSWSFGTCGSVTGLAGFAISEVTGIPVEDEFWSHSDLDCNEMGGLTELERGINFGDLGWTDQTTYQFRFEVSETEILVYLNDILEVNITGSFNTTGNFCYYNFSQERVRYSGLTRQTEPPTPAPTVPLDTTPPECEVVEVMPGGVILARASDAESGISSLTLDPPSANLVLMSDFTPGDVTVDFSVSILDEDSVNTDFRDTAVLVENTDGGTCVFPTIGSILDDDCTDDDQCQPDLAIEFPFPTNDPGVPSFDFSSAVVLVEPAFADIEFNGTSLLYVPRWTGIYYDSFALESKTVFGDTFILSADYNGTEQTVEVQIDIIGQWFEYMWFDEDFDDGENRRLADRQPTLPIEWHHEIPKGVFVDGKNPIEIEGVDLPFVNRPENGVILRRGDHRTTGSPISTAEYNQLWRDWVQDFQNSNGGRLPTRDELIDVGLEEIRQDPRVKEMNSRGIRNHGIDYGDWNDSRNRAFKEQTLAKLDNMARTRSQSRVLSKSRTARKLAKVGKVIPLIGDVISVGILLNDVLVNGRPIGDAILDSGQDAIPVWGELRALYSLARDLGLFESLGLKVDANSLETLVWELILDLFGLEDVNDRNSDNVAEAYPGKIEDKMEQDESTMILTNSSSV